MGENLRDAYRHRYADQPPREATGQLRGEPLAWPPPEEPSPELAEPPTELDDGSAEWDAAEWDLQALNNAGDPTVSKVVYALRDLGVEGQAVALDVLGAVGGAGLTPAQTAAVLTAISDRWSPERDPAWDSQWTWDSQAQEWVARE